MCFALFGLKLLKSVHPSVLFGCVRAYGWGGKEGREMKRGGPNDFLEGWPDI